MENLLFKYHDRLGFINPFYLKKDNSLIIETAFENIVKHKNDPNIIDPVTILEILNKSYTFGDRTLIQGINLTPWMAKPHQLNRSWEYVDNLPPHGVKVVDAQEAAEVLFEKLLIEVKEYIGEFKNVGILLSGGMDSRIIACAIKYLQDRGAIDVKVSAITWGMENSRDVVYAKQISKLFNWEWKHFELSSNNLMENIGVAAKNGLLYSPVHLHAMPQIRDLKNIDCIIAGSFGDSVGRSEYSGVKTANLISTTAIMRNKFKIIRSNIYGKNLKNAHEDIINYHKLFPRKEDYQYFELEKQIHYMRKQLNQCMAVINQKIPLFQAMTSSEIFGYMWSLSPEVRNDKIYYYILKKYSSTLLEIPWARTGCPYLSENLDGHDGYSKNYHNYGEWIRKDINPLIKEKVLSSNIESLNVFNMKVLRNLVMVNSFSKGKMMIIDEYLVWLASLSDFVKQYDIKGLDLKRNILQDKIDSNVLSILHFIAFKIKNSLRG
jgi:Asparagine synthase